MLKHAAAKVFAIFVAMCGALNAAHADDVAFQLDSAHTGHLQLKKGLQTPLTLVWKRDLGGGVSYPLIADGRIFVTVAGTYPNGSYLVALDATDGTVLWQHPIDGPYNWSNATYENGRVFVNNFYGTVQAFRAASGTLLRTTTLRSNNLGSFFGPPVADQGLIYLAGVQIDGRVFTVEQTTGNPSWGDFTIGGGDEALAVSQGLVFGAWPAQYYGYNESTGQPVWHDSLGGDGGGGFAPVQYGSNLFVRDVIGDSVLDASTGAIVGKFHSTTAPAIYRDGDGNIFLMELTGGRLQCFDWVNQKSVWRFSDSGRTMTIPPIVVNNEVIEGDESGNLFVLDAVKGKKIWSTNVGSPIVGTQEGTVAKPLSGFGADNGLLVVPASNTLLVYAPKKKQA